MRKKHLPFIRIGTGGEVAGIEGEAVVIDSKFGGEERSFSSLNGNHFIIGLFVIKDSLVGVSFIFFSRVPTEEFQLPIASVCHTLWNGLQDLSEQFRMSMATTFVLIATRMGWSPVTSKVRMKMVYESSKDRFKRELDGIQVELQATDPSEMSLEIIKSRAL
uniref:Uncharacterized protein LOC104219791 n=1 Tax=Nicotiana sylvestris TaxID=4096 RepID=A0A1U7VV45_NICSY|nr:PREDICTED: uncharacterized protein LOC104219791 [Nicotiana sylvestris]